ncbi:hypothetical protein NEOLEDRAFT_1176305 [Neolentinus lepideus HHB14362 ss-1]|uniref:DUF6533 domain-containing protein n=1 Tax=Neolentinus lepideus HHB14362 ss-1 TaxID=1314782 RepID=A0A165UHE1_9AGAM|nr:hypothetical protein NEOLEDRAFT_1176305 [Neolentinus lepideus HHB14362 ss-1]
MSSAESLALALDANYYLGLVAFSILYYDYALTIGIEVDRFWSPRWNWASFLFYLNRYLGIFGHIPVALQLFREFSSEMLGYHQIYSVVVQIIVGACLIMRTYALYERARWILWFTCGFALGVIIFGTWAITGKHTEPVPIKGIGCNSTLSADQGLHLAIAWAGMTAFDAMIVILTVIKALCTPRVGRRTLVDVLLRDGTLYFGFMVVSNIVNVLTFVLGGPLLRGAPSTFTNVVSTTLVSRLMLNVRDPKLKISSRSTTFSSASSTPYVSTVVNNFHMTLTTVVESEWNPNQEENGISRDEEIELVPRNSLQEPQYNPRSLKPQA